MNPESSVFAWNSANQLQLEVLNEIRSERCKALSEREHRKAVQANLGPQRSRQTGCVIGSRAVCPSAFDLQPLLPSPPTPSPAANYSVPVVLAPHGPSEDTELTFTCTSVNGYPKPNVYWINKTDNSVLPEGLQNSTVVLNARGLYDVVSVLRIGWTPSVNVGCCIENVLLHQNLTGLCQTGKVPRGPHAESSPNLGAYGDSGTGPCKGSWLWLLNADWKWEEVTGSP